MTARRARLLAVGVRGIVAAAGAGIAVGGCTLLTSLDGLSDGAGGALEDGPTPIDGVGGDEARPQPDAPITSDGPAPKPDAASSSRYAAAVLADGPLLYYRFGEKSGSPARDEVTGTTTAYSITGLTYGAAGALAADPDTAVTTDGTGVLSLTQKTDFEGLAPYSVEIWVSASPTGNAGGFLVDHETFTGDRGGWLLRVTTSDVGFERWEPLPDGGSTPRAIGSGLTAAAGVWHHVVGTFDGTTMRLYLDGVRADSGGASNALPVINMPFSIGKQNCTPCSGNGFVGMIDELAIYPKALAEDRITAHFSAAH